MGQACIFSPPPSCRCDKAGNMTFDQTVICHI